MTTPDRTSWLVEHTEASPVPIYATDGPYPICNPYDAKGFETEDEARTWMSRPGVIPYYFPWKPVLHGFIGLGHVDS